jgi:hypothetical protein
MAWETSLRLIRVGVRNVILSLAFAVIRGLRTRSIAPNRSRGDTSIRSRLSAASPQPTLSTLMSAEHKRMFCRVAYLPPPFLSTLSRSNLSDSGFAARDSEFRSEFEFACSANPSLVSVSIEYLAKLRGQSGSREWLLNEMCFARFNTPAQHSIGCITTHENHGDGGVIPTHTIS